MSQEGQLAKNTIIYAIGNFGSKILGYIMVLVYSYYLHSDELGYYDLILTTISMIQPIVLLQINDSIYRFMIDISESSKKTVATAFRFVISIVILSLIIFIPIALLSKIRYTLYIIIYYVSLMIFTCIQEAVRGYSRIKLYASFGIINSGITLVFEFIGLIVLHQGVETLLISKSIANIVCICIAIINTPIISDFFSSKFDLRLFKKILLYSMPLVPNVVCWWIMNSSDRYIIRYFIGTSANGIYAISNKFPTILTAITSVFYLAWQESAIKEYTSHNRDQFFSKIFNQYFRILFTLCAVLIPITRIIVELLVAVEYKTSWYYTSPLYIAVAFSALCSYLGIGYQISKETIKSFYTTVISATINIVTNLSLVHTIGLHAASISTLIAYFALFILRIFHSKCYYNITYNVKEEVALIFLCFVSCFFTFIFNNMLILTIISMFMLLTAIYVNRKLINPLIRKIIRNG